MVSIDDFTRIKNDTNGNPRYVCHFLRLNIPADDCHDVSQKYNIALARSRGLGGRKFHNKQYGGGIAFQSYNLAELCNEINAELNQTIIAEGV